MAHVSCSPETQKPRPTLLGPGKESWVGLQEVGMPTLRGCLLSLLLSLVQVGGEEGRAGVCPTIPLLLQSAQAHPIPRAPFQQCGQALGIPVGQVEARGGPEGCKEYSLLEQGYYDPGCPRQH